MIGCVLATVGVIGLIKWMRFRHGFGCGGPWGGGPWARGPWGRHHHHHHHRACGKVGWDEDPEGLGGPNRWGGRGMFLRSVLEPLEMTPAQERVVFAALDEMREAGRSLRGEGAASRRDIAQAFRKGSFDEVQMGELYARHDRALESLRKTFVGTGAKIHDALDERQRARLADLIESGPGRFFGHSFGRHHGPSPWSW